VFGFFGITDVQFVRAEGLSMGAESKAKAIADAEMTIHALTAIAANETNALQVA
jgi:FMN-dependent NADH-azoreductase